MNKGNAWLFRQANSVCPFLTNKKKVVTNENLMPLIALAIKCHRSPANHGESTEIADPDKRLDQRLHPVATVFMEEDINNLAGWRR